MAKLDKATLPVWWYLILAVTGVVGLVLLFTDVAAPAWLIKVTAKVRPDKWPTFVAIYLLSIVFSHFAVFCSLLLTRWLFVLTSPTSGRRNLWPPALLGVLESILYPTAFIIGHTDFIGLWLLLKVAGQWPRWTREIKATDDVDAPDEGRRRYYQFLIGNALNVILAAASYAIIKILVLA